MKFLTVILTLLALSTLAACESSPVRKSTGPADNSKTIGNSDVHVSGTLETGGSVSNR